MTENRRLLEFLGRSVLIATVLGTLQVTPAAGQTNEETFQQFQWAFDSPGARAKAMGKAFIAVADDATATVSNPAGLAALSRRQVYVEYATSNMRTARTRDTVDVATGATSGAAVRANSLTFIDLAFPIRQNVTLGLSRHRFLDYKDRFELGPRLLRLDPTTFVPTIILPVVGTSEFSGVTYGASVAARVNPRINVGVSVNVASLDAKSILTRFEPLGLSGRTDVVSSQNVIDDSALGASVVLGAIYRRTDTFSAGVTYSKGPFFSLQQSASWNPGAPTDNQSLVPTGPAFTIHLNVPERLGGGLAARPWSRLLVSIDAVIIRYSDLTKDIVPLLGGSEHNFTIDDRTELRFGSEYVARRGSIPLRLRAGLFTDPDHSIKFEGTTGHQDTDVAFQLLFNSHDRRTRYVVTCGVGAVLARRVQLDAAYLTRGDVVVSGAFQF